MQIGKILLIGLTVTACLSLLSGCSSAPAKRGKPSASVKAAQAAPQPEVVYEYVVKPAPKQSPARVTRALPLIKPVQSRRNNSHHLAKQTAVRKRQELENERLRLQRQSEWEAKQLQDAKRAEYRRKWEQKQALEKQRQAALKVQQARTQQENARRLQAQRVAEAKRQQYHDKWQQDQVRKQQEQARRRQQMQRQQAQARQRQQPAPQYQQVARRNTQPTRGYGGRGTGNYYAQQLTGSFAGNRQLLGFIEDMVASHGFDRGYLYGVFSRTRNRDSVARLWAGNGGGKSSGRGWYNYRSKFVTPGNIQKGVQFWRQYQPHIIRASRQYGVDPEYIVGIMGVETRWGRILGKHKVIDALTTSAIVNKRRSRFFFKELKNYLLMTRSERMDPLQPKGSYAGAMGYGQFMPSSFRAFAVDFNGDGVRDLWNPVDAIGSIANYFAKHHWKPGQEVVVPAKVSSMAYASMPDGFKVKYSRSRLANKGIRPRSGRWSRTGRTHLLALTTVPGGVKEPWIGYHNFYVITRYNHSNYYAMAVHQLSKAIQSQVTGQKYASR